MSPITYREVGVHHAFESYTPLSALANGSFIFVAVVVVIFFAVAFGFYTRRGSGINEHPSDGLDGAPGAQGRSEVSGKDQGESSALDTHGMR